MRKLIHNLTSFLAMLAAVGLPAATHASDYPNRPITLVAPYGPGGASDLSARLVAGSAPAFPRRSDTALHRMLMQRRIAVVRPAVMKQH